MRMLGSYRGWRGIALLLLCGVLLLSMGVALARFSSTVRGSLLFEVKPLDAGEAIQLNAPDGWQATETGTVLTFTVSGTNGASRQACLRLTATEGLSPDTPVTLTVNGVDYEGVPRAIDPHELLYRQMGAGTEFCFYDAGDELLVSLSGEQTLVLTVAESADAALLCLTVTEY